LSFFTILVHYISYNIEIDFRTVFLEFHDELILFIISMGKKDSTECNHKFTDHLFGAYFLT